MSKIKIIHRGREYIWYGREGHVVLKKCTEYHHTDTPSRQLKIKEWCLGKKSNRQEVKDSGQRAKKTEKVTSKRESSKKNQETMSVVYDKGQEGFKEEVYTQCLILLRYQEALVSWLLYLNIEKVRELFPRSFYGNSLILRSRLISMDWRNKWIRIEENSQTTLSRSLKIKCTNLIQNHDWFQGLESVTIGCKSVTLLHLKLTSPASLHFVNVPTRLQEYLYSSHYISIGQPWSRECIWDWEKSRIRKAP